MNDIYRVYLAAYVTALMNTTAEIKQGGDERLGAAIALGVRDGKGPCPPRRKIEFFEDT